VAYNETLRYDPGDSLDGALCISIEAQGSRSQSLSLLPLFTVFVCAYKRYITYLFTYILRTTCAQLDRHFSEEPDMPRLLDFLVPGTWKHSYPCIKMRLQQWLHYLLLLSQLASEPSQSTSCPILLFNGSLNSRPCRVSEPSGRRMILPCDVHLINKLHFQLLSLEFAKISQVSISKPRPLNDSGL
jgi:hypothetical protein